LPSERYEASNPVDKKKKKRSNMKKKNKQGSTLPTTARHVGKQPVTDNHAGSVDGAKITQKTHKPKYPCSLCKGIHILKDFPGLSKVIEAWSTTLSNPCCQPLNNMLMTSHQLVTIQLGRRKVESNSSVCYAK
jgi:hypothetical protein